MSMTWVYFCLMSDSCNIIRSHTMSRTQERVDGTLSSEERIPLLQFMGIQVFSVLKVKQDFSLCRRPPFAVSKQPNAHHRFR